jgi:hypothetical protein
VRLSSTDSSDAETSFEIERKTGDGPFAVITAVAPNVTTLIDTDVAGGVPSTYRVRVIGPTGRSAALNAGGAGVDFMREAVGGPSCPTPSR